MSSLKILKFQLIFLFSVMIAGCSFSSSPSGPTSVTPNTSAAMQKATMRPYTINGKTYYPTIVKVGDTQNGTASWYGPNFHGKKTSNGEIYNMHNLTAAHKTLPMNTIVRVVNLKNKKDVIVRINDRGPFVANRIIDLSRAAATKIDMIGAGTAPVSMEVIGFSDQSSATLKTAKTTTKQPDKGAQMSGIIISSEQSIVGGDFMVQIGAFKNKDGAYRYQRENASIDGYKAVVKTYYIDGVPIYRVFLDGFRSEDEARDYAHSARNGKFEGAFIVRGER